MVHCDSHRFVWAGWANINLARCRGPQTKAHAPVVATLGAERHAIASLHLILPSCRFRAVPATRPSTAPAMGKLRPHRRYRRIANRLLEKYPSTPSTGYRHGRPATQIQHLRGAHSEERGSFRPQVSVLVHRSHPVPGRRETFPDSEAKDRATPP